MNRETQDRIINLSSALLTALVIAIVGYFSFSSFQKIQMASIDDPSLKVSDENRIAKSERIDTEEVIEEMNRIAEAQRLEKERLEAE
ncbi:hypothetical protein FK530_25185 [Tsukamurella conjunctivitidis]|nr:hypothetical protein [Tsukamurella conjunctivitidis]TWS21652.1 hypothetical protein FK530_25185 [Tsukamurella conjunctivitidis]